MYQIRKLLGLRLPIKQWYLKLGEVIKEAVTSYQYGTIHLLKLGKYLSFEAKAKRRIALFVYIEKESIYHFRNDYPLPLPKVRITFYRLESVPNLGRKL